MPRFGYENKNKNEQKTWAERDLLMREPRAHALLYTEATMQQYADVQQPGASLQTGEGPLYFVFYCLVVCAFCVTMKRMWVVCIYL